MNDRERQASQRLLLNDRKIVETLTQLEHRIAERFPDSGLAKLCGELLLVAQQASERSAWIGRPIIWIRVCGYALVLLMILLLAQAVRMIGFRMTDLTFTEFIQTFEAGMNEVLLMGAAIYFLISLETRIKRRRALAAVHELRSIAHIIDMHQLTKYPDRSLTSNSDTEHSPKRDLTP
ncbi:MAG: hypothetical protein AAGA03_16405, partial [Planctomycetota bacterium]